MATIPTSRACWSNSAGAALAAALTLLPGAAPGGELVRDQKLFMSPSGPRVGVFARRQVVPYAPDGKPGKALSLEKDAVEGALSPDGSRLALSLMGGGLIVLDLDKAETATVEDTEQCANLAWGEEGTLHYSVNRFTPGKKEPVITFEVRRLAAGAKKPTVSSSLEVPIPPPPVPPMMPVLPGMPPGAGAAPAPGAAPPTAPAPPKKKR